MLAIVIGLSTILAGCPESQLPTASGKGIIRGIAAINDAPELLFRIEERPVGVAVYKGVAGFNAYDNLPYNFNFDMPVPGAEDLVRLATQAIDVAVDTEYTLILTGSVDNPVITMWEEPQREWPEDSTMFEPIFAHFSDEIGAVDIYFHEPGTMPVLGNAIGTLSNGERLAGRDFAVDTYEMVVTAAGDPGNVFYQSSNIGGAATTRPILAIFNSDPSIPGPVPVNLIGENGTSIDVPDPAYLSQIRLYHASFGQENVDLYYGTDFTNRVFTDIGFKDISDYEDIDISVPAVTLTAVDNTGAIILQNSIATSLGNRRTLVVAGDVANPVFNTLLDNGRPLSTYPLFRVANFAVNSSFITVYQEEPGTELTEFTRPTFVALASQGDTGLLTSNSGTWEITITNFGSLEPIAPPLLVDLDAGEIVDIAILDTVDPEVFELDVFAGK